MSSSFHFNLSIEEEIDFLNKCSQYVDTSRIPSENAIPAFEFEEFKQLFLSKQENKKKRKRKDRIIVGVHSPSIPIYSYKQETNTINTRVNQVNIEQEPPQKKQKLSDNNNHNNNNNKEKQKNQESEQKIPPGCETLFDSESGELVDELQDLDPKLVKQIGYELLVSKDSTSFDDIGGLQLEKKKIKQIVIWPLKHPEMYDNSGLRQRPKGVLLFGPPGTGKTMIAKAIATEADASFFCITPSTLASKWVGESAKLVRTMISIAKYLSPSIIFIDEIDSLLSKRQSDGKDHMNTMKTQFLMELEGVKSNNNDNVLIIGATNFPEAIDEAARRRFSKRLYIPLPDKHGRRQLIKILLKHDKHNLNENDIEILVNKTNGYSGSDIKNVATTAASFPVNELMSNNQDNNNDERLSAGSLRPITLKDFEKGLKEQTASVSQESLQKYLDWNERYGAKLS